MDSHACIFTALEIVSYLIYFFLLSHGKIVLLGIFFAFFIPLVVHCLEVMLAQLLQISLIKSLIHHPSIVHFASLNFFSLLLRPNPNYSRNIIIRCFLFLILPRHPKFIQFCFPFINPIVFTIYPLVPWAL